MIIKYKILSIDEQEQSMVVRFYTDKITEQMLASQIDAEGNILRCRTDMNITLADVQNRPRGANIEEFIVRRFAPWQFLLLKEYVADPLINTSMSDLTPYVGVELSREVDVIEGQLIMKPKT